MSIHVVLPALVIFLHDLFTVLWIGGILTMAIVVMPALRAERRRSAQAAQPAPAGPPPGSPPQLLVAMQSRMGPVALISLVGLVVTGVLLARRGGAAGIARFDTAWAAVLSIKHILVVVVIVLSLLRRGLSKKNARAAGALLVVNAVLAVLILALSALNAALSAA